MPELPEVENVKLSLHKMGFIGQEFSQVKLLRDGLRVAFPREIEKVLKGQTIRAIRRRAKYILFETENYFLVNHLGMTGSWRSEKPVILQKHDHVILRFKSGLQLVFNDPRRFGLLDLVERGHLATNRWLKNLGVEPLTPEFDGAFLFSRTRRMKGSIKAFLMDQKRVVGVGNIYASEALFAAGVKPTRQAGKISKREARELVLSIQRILHSAILAGGSTIRDYRNSQGEEGNFQARFQVYDRASLPCFKCNAEVRAKPIAGRNSFWCPRCQR